jgi:hypothetical protein
VIWDTFLFFNELDVLELRLHELNSCVDKFVFVEATWTHQLQPKPLIFAQNRDRFAAFADKIVYLTIEGIPRGVAPGSSAAHYSRSFLLNGLKNCSNSDIILLSDLDEIPRPEVIRELSGKITPNDKWVLKHNTYCYCINLLMTIKWLGTTVVTYEYLMNVYGGKLHMLRFARKKRGSGRIDDGGWHFTFLGDALDVSDKLKAYADSEWTNDNVTNVGRIDQCIKSRVNCLSHEPLTVVEIDDTYPRYIQENLGKFRKYIYPSGRATC